MSTKKFFTKGWPTRIGYGVAKVSPPWLGGILTGVLARIMMLAKSDVYWAICGNLTQVLGPAATPAKIRQMTYRVFLNTFRGYYEFFHNMGLGRDDVTQFEPPVRMAPAVRTYIDRAVETGRGLMLLGCHMSNFDLAGIGLSQMLPLPVQALSIADPPSGFEFFNRLRERGNGIVTPITPQSLRQAIERLRSGGIVLTGVDRPTGEADEPATFFGRTALLPAGYIRIPYIADSLVMTVSFLYQDGAYWIVANPPFNLARTGDRHRDAELNRRRVLSEIEDHIRRAPDQWMMFVPVWKQSS